MLILRRQRLGVAVSQAWWGLLCYREREPMRAGKSMCVCDMVRWRLTWQVLVDEMLSSLEVVNCQGVKIQVRHDRIRHAARQTASRRTEAAAVSVHSIGNSRGCCPPDAHAGGRVTWQVRAKVPTVAIDKTDGIIVILSKDALDAVITTSKSSEMYVTEHSTHTTSHQADPDPLSRTEGQAGV